MLSNICVCSVSARWSSGHRNRRGSLSLCHSGRITGSSKTQLLSGKGVGGELLSVIACSGCYHGAPQALGAVAGAGRALNGRKVFAHSSAGRKSKIRCCQGSPRPADGHLTASSRGRPAMSVSSSPLPRRTPAVLGEDPPHDPLCLSSLFKGPVSGLPRWSSG